MKKLFLFSIVLFVFSLLSQAKSPRWVSKLPIPEDESYVYRCESATDDNEEQARNKALAKVMQASLMRLGATINNSVVSEALRTGKTINTGDCALIGINPVCSYSEKIEGGYRYYVLCQVSTQAPTQSWQPNFKTFRSCGSQSSNDIVEVDYPEEWWEIIDSKDYVETHMHDTYTKDVSRLEALQNLQDKAERNLKEKLGIGDGDSFLSYCEKPKTFFSNNRKDGADGFVLVYISKPSLSAYYERKYKKIITRVDDTFEELEKSPGEVSDMDMQDVLFQLDQAETYINYLKSFDIDTEDHEKEVKRRRTKLKRYFQQDDAAVEQGRQDKIHSFLVIGEKAEKAGKIDMSLKHYYWANILLLNLKNSEKLSFSDLHEGELVSIWLPNTIQAILDSINVYYADKTEDDVLLLKFNYGPNHRPIESVEYRYYTTTGKSAAHYTRDGIGTIEWEEPELPKEIMLDIEYMFKTDNTDQELITLVNQHSIYAYGKYARKTVKLNKKIKEEVFDNGLELPMSVQARQTGNMLETIINKGKYGQGLAKLEQDVKDVYNVRLMSVCEAIKEKNPRQVKELFTEEGYELFTKLVQRANGKNKVNILNKDNITYSRLGDNVVARSIKMSFNFVDSKKQFIENVVFEFDKYKKICNVRYMAEESVIKDIVGFKSSDEQKLALLDFLENYRTSYALKDTNFLTKTFSEDAVIITGRVIKPRVDELNAKKVELKDEYIKYTRHTKQSYLKALSKTFNRNEWINLAFSDVDVRTGTGTKFGYNVFGIRLKQDWQSSTYGDNGYLFLMVDMTEYENPVIYVRTWQPTPDIREIGGDGLFDFQHFKVY